MATNPIAPKVPAQLDNWADAVDANVEIDQALVTGTNFAGVTRLSVDASRVSGASAMQVVLDKLELTDAEFTKFEAAAMQAYKANLLRVTMSDCRLTGAEFAEANFEDCTFKNVKFDEVGFRFATFKRVRFENCMLRQADFGNAKLSHVTFTGCDLEETNFMSAVCVSVDITTENLTTAKGILGLKGSTISEEQLLQLAPLLASELGFHIKD